MAFTGYKWLVLCGAWIALSSARLQNSPPEVSHPFYVSVTEINLNSADKTLEVSCKMFADDLEQIIEKINRTQLDISTEKDKPSFDKYIPAYLANHLTVAIDGKKALLSYLGFEKEKESVYCYFQVEGIHSFKKIDIANSLLHDFSNEQINIVHVTVNGKRQSTKLDFPDRSASFSF